MSKAKKFDKLICLDLEATCDEPYSKDYPTEIIEIGVCLLDLKTLEISDVDGIIVKPQKSRITEYCYNLTSISQEMVDKGISLQEAMGILKTKYKIHKRSLCVYGEYDKKMLIKDCEDKGLIYPGINRSCINLKNLLAIEYGWDKEIGLDKAVQYFGLEFEGHHHRGFSDAKMTAKIYQTHLEIIREHAQQTLALMKYMNIDALNKFLKGE